MVGDVVCSRLASRELDEVGDRTCAGRTVLPPCIAARTRFFIVSPSISFSLSPPEISVLHRLVYLDKIDMMRSSIPETLVAACSGWAAVCFLGCVARQCVLGWYRRSHRRLLLVEILEEQIFHLHFSQRCRNSVDADFYPRSKALSLEVILGAKSTSSLGDCIISILYTYVAGR